MAAEGGPATGRLVVFGTSSIVADALLQRVPGVANLFFVQNAIHWLTAEEDLISIPPTAPDSRPITPRTNPLLLLLTTAVLAPLAVLGMGTWIWWRRR